METFLIRINFQKPERRRERHARFHDDARTGMWMFVHASTGVAAVAWAEKLAERYLQVLSGDAMLSGVDFGFSGHLVEDTEIFACVASLRDVLEVREGSYSGIEDAARSARR